MKMEILIVSYWKDAPWLEHCLRSIDKYASGFSGTTVVYPYRDMDALGPICKRNDVAVRMFQEVEGKGHLHQNAIKCHADIYCPGADCIVHIDSDCLFVQPTTPMDFFRNEKPIHLYQHYDRLSPVNIGDVTALAWKEPTERATGYHLDLEFMKCLPIIHKRQTYWGARSVVERLHGTSLIDYALNCKSAFPYGFSEFNLLGAYAHNCDPEGYAWQDVDIAGLAPMNWHVWQLWSHGGDGYVHPSFYGATQAQVVDIVLNSDLNAHGQDPFPLFEKIFKVHAHN